jgi:hypothetical protein
MASPQSLWLRKYPDYVYTPEVDDDDDESHDYDNLTSDDLIINTDNLSNADSTLPLAIAVTDPDPLDFDDDLEVGPVDNLDIPADVPPDVALCLPPAR